MPAGLSTMDFAGERETRESAGPVRGSSQQGMRAYNERLVLSLIRRHGALAKADIARLTGLSAQTVSVIMRALEADQLLLRDAPVRGRVGQPSVPMRLNPQAVFSYGLKLGRRSSDLTLIDFAGQCCGTLQQTYPWPTVEGILKFTHEGVAELGRRIKNPRARIAGLGIAAPYELWNWADEVGAPEGAMDEWRHVDLAAELAALLPFAVMGENDATAACGAELLLGRGRSYADFLYVFIGSFIGGGVVLDHALYAGRSGNAGALGSMPVTGPDGRPVQLIDVASLFTLERALKQAGGEAGRLWRQPQDWSGFAALVDQWLATTAHHLGQAIVAASAVIDFSACVIDGAFPPDVRARLVDLTRAAMNRLDLQGLTPPQVVEGAVGAGARAMGGACLPLFRRFLLDRDVLLKEVLDAEGT
jgi:predicted NBD/HSP70 family sugar kinase